MKSKFNVFIFFAVVFVGSSFAQRNNGMNRMRAKVEQFEKIKLIETLNLNEDESIRFFARRNEYKENQKKMLAERDSLYKLLSVELSSGKDAELAKMRNEILDVDSRILIKRKEFLNSLGDLLSEKEIAKYVLFEYNFRNEIRKQLIKQYKHRMGRM